MRALKIVNGLVGLFEFADGLFCRMTQKLDNIIPEMPEENALAAQHDELVLYVSRKMGVTSVREIDEIGRELQATACLLSPVAAEFERTGREGGQMDVPEKGRNNQRDAAPSDFAPMI